jgi:hypothetical protein
MIENGKICTIWPDCQIQYEITNVISKPITIMIDNKSLEQVSYFVDLKELNGNSILNNVSIYHINLIND